MVSMLLVVGDFYACSAFDFRYTHFMQISVERNSSSTWGICSGDWVGWRAKNLESLLADQVRRNAASSLKASLTVEFPRLAPSVHCLFHSRPSVPSETFS